MRSAVRSDRHGQRRRALPGLRWPSTESQSWSRAVSCRETGAGVQPSQGAVSPPHVTARVRVQAPCAPHSLLWNHGWPAATALDSADSRTLPPSWKSLRWWPRCPQHCPRPLGPFGGSSSQGTALSAAVTCAPCCSEVLWHGWAAPGPAHWGGQPRARAESCSLGTRGPQSHSETQSHPSSATGFSGPQVSYRKGGNDSLCHRVLTRNPSDICLCGKVPASDAGLLSGDSQPPGLPRASR